jgi:hypothetical protein
MNSLNCTLLQPYMQFNTCGLREQLFEVNLDAGIHVKIWTFIHMSKNPLGVWFTHTEGWVVPLYLLRTVDSLFASKGK